MDDKLFFTVVSGNPSEDELAVLAAVLSLPRGNESEGQRPARSVWNDRSRLMRPDISPSPDGWRRSALPR